MPAPRPRQISDILPKLQNVSTTSNFLVKFALPSGGDGSGFFNGGLRGHLRRKGVNDRFIADDAGLLCSDAVLPGSALATINTVGDYQGLVERMVHTRNFTQISLEFYVDKDYKMIKFFEHWMDYISSGSEKRRITSFSKASPGYFYRMRYPKGDSGYKCDKTKIVKFNVDYNKEIEYTFIGMFPINLASTPVQYGNSDVLKVNCTFNYERYIAGESTNLSIKKGISENNS